MGILFPSSHFCIRIKTQDITTTVNSDVQLSFHSSELHSKIFCVPGNTTLKRSKHFIKVRFLHMGNNMVSCDLRRQLVYSYHLITKFLCHLWEATQANVSSHLIMKRKNRQNVLEKQTALITPSQCSLRIWKKSIVQTSSLYKEVASIKDF